MKRSELKRLAELRRQDALSLLQQRRYGACYYLAGYAVECALKACIAKQFNANTIPDPKRVNNIYTHQVEVLVGIAGLKTALDTEAARDPDFEANWNVVKDWKPERRYQLGVTRTEAQGLYDAIDDPHHGVFQWLQRNW